MYGGGNNSDNDGVRGSRVDSSEQCMERADPILDLLSDSYSKLDVISVSISGLPSYPTSHYLLTTCLLPY